MSYNWQTVKTEVATADLPATTSGTYEIEVVAINGLGIRSSTATFTQDVTAITALAVTAPPPDVTGVSIAPIDQSTALITWDSTSDINVLVGGKVIIHHAPVTNGATWGTSSPIIEGIPGNQTAFIVPLLEGTYLLKFITNGGVRSPNATSSVVKLPDPHPRLLVRSFREDLTGFDTLALDGDFDALGLVDSLTGNGPFAGVLDDLYYAPERGGLAISSDVLFDTIAADGNFDLLGTLDSIGGVSAQGTYEFFNSVDMSAVYDVNIRRYISVLPFNVAAFFDDNLGDLDTWGDFDGTDVSDTNATLYVRTTVDDPSQSPSWSAWQVCINNIVQGRGFEFKIVATSKQSSQNIVLEKLGATIELQQRTEASETLVSGTTTYVATFDYAFYSTPAIHITPINMATGDYFTLSSPTTGGFQVAFFNSGGSPVSRQFTYTAVGYGRRI